MPDSPLNDSNLQTLSLTFTVPHRQATHLTVHVQPNREPAQTGHHLIFPSDPVSNGLDFPTCTAKLHSPTSTGYAATYGWIQMTREGPDAATAATADWEMDPIPITADLNTPFVWFGPEAQLFDAPSRTDRGRDLDWTCWSFLAYVEDAVISKKVRPVLGFEWGFGINMDEVVVKSLKLLGCEEAWEEQRRLLEGSFKGWEFLPLDEAVKIGERGTPS